MQDKEQHCRDPEAASVSLSNQSGHLQETDYYSNFYDNHFLALLSSSVI